MQAQRLFEVTVHCLPLKRDKSHYKEIYILKCIPIKKKNANSSIFPQGKLLNLSAFQSHFRFRVWRFILISNRGMVNLILF